MLRENNKLIVRAHRFLDIILTALAFVSAYFIKKYLLTGQIGGLSTGPNYYALLLLVIIISYMVFNWFELYRSYRTQALRVIMFRVIQAVLFSSMAFAFVLYLFKIEGVSRLMILIFVLLDTSFLVTSKTIVFYSLKRLRKQGHNTRNVILVGSKERAKDILKEIDRNKDSGYRVTGCLEIDSELVGTKVVDGVDVIESLENLEKVLTERVVDELIFAMPVRIIDDAGKYLAISEKMGVNTRIVPDWRLNSLFYEPRIATLNFEGFFSIPTLSLHATSTNVEGLLIKNVFDYLVSRLLLVLCMPFFIWVALFIKIASPGPVFYKQERMGKNGRLFYIYKFRTMVPDADQMLETLMEMNEADGPAFKIKNDPRIIPYVGTFLRKTSMDELPQLINVVRGEMSLVGPRPPIPDEVDQYELWQRRRLSVKPGLTCIWQVAPRRNDISFDGWMEMDMKYIDNWSLWLDLKILFTTVRAVAFGAGR